MLLREVTADERRWTQIKDLRFQILDFICVYLRSSAVSAFEPRERRLSLAVRFNARWAYQSPRSSRQRRVNQSVADATWIQSLIRTRR
jgi:hypothetical protein